MSFKKNLQGRFLNVMQKYVSWKFNRFGLSNRVLNQQVWINKKRHEHDIADGNELLYEEFVQ